MLACRVCLEVGIDDPEAWLDQVRPRQLAIWDAFFQVEPWGAAREHSASVSSLLSALIAMTAAGNGQSIDIQQVADFMPANWIGRKGQKRKPKPKPEDMEKTIALAFPTARHRRIN